MNLTIRNICTGDLPEIAALMQEFAAFENLSDSCDATEERLHMAMFGDGAFVDGLIAFDGAAPVGYAIFYPGFSSFRGQRGMYLEDIYVQQNHQGRGIGLTMLKTIAATAASRGFERIDFQVLNWNTNAVKFYETLGAVSNDDETHYKFADEAFQKLASPS